MSALMMRRLLKALEGRTTDFHSFARDTPKGKATDCHICWANAREVDIPGEPDMPGACLLPRSSGTSSCCACKFARHGCWTSATPFLAGRINVRRS